MSVIIGRALPDIRDGLKPVHRRILFAMNIMNNFYNKPYKKSARIVGDVIGKYHPHGDNAVYDSIVRMAQSFSLRYPLINGQGNFGSIDGDSAAAMRYTEIRMSKISHELLKDLEKNTVKYSYNYDNTEIIPDVMPTRIPNLLINGSSGIAVGMATNIPPHNLTEIINGCLAYIKNPDISIKELIKYIPGPDFPTAGIINGKQGIEDAYSTGKGKIYIKSKVKIKLDKKSKKETIIIKEIPYQVNKSRLIEKIAELVKERKLEGISALRDESDKDGMRIVIDIKRDSVSSIVLNNLYSLTQLQISFGINMVALYRGQPKILSLKDIISSFINHRQEIITKRTIFDLKKTCERVHILEALTIALYNIDYIINLIKNSSSTLEAKNKLKNKKWLINNKLKIFNKKDNLFKIFPYFKRKFNKKNNLYSFTENQIKSILDLRLQRLTNLENKKILEEYNILLNKIKQYNKLLNNSDLLMEVICQELKIIKKEYYDCRLTKITSDIKDITLKDLINKEDVVVTLSYQGYVKYQPLIDYEAQRRGGKGKSAARIKEKDFIYRLLVANTHDTILLFSSRGRVYWMKVYQLPEASRGSRGKPIVNLIPLKNNERITAILPLRKYKKNNMHVFMATSSGIVKKTSLTEFSRPRNAGIIAIHLKKGDELIGIDLVNGKNEVMLFSSYGKVVLFPENQVRSMGRVATGVIGINLLKGDKVISLIIPHSEGPILTVTQYGYGKQTMKKEYPIKSRATQGVISIKVTKRNGKVVGAVQVNKYDQIMMITDAGTLVRTRVSEVSIIGRNTHGVTLIRTSDNEKVVGLQRLIESVKSKK
uniref:DNA topoisomerase (ATP-hydrolyzing) subunit A n=1 Tax=Sodalis-like secondary symbiont of Drepanosiphum platanoidis TaxID=2994493 RepID=UPI003F5C856B